MVDKEAKSKEVYEYVKIIINCTHKIEEKGSNCLFLSKELNVNFVYICMYIYMYIYVCI